MKTFLIPVLVAIAMLSASPSQAADASTPAVKAAESWLALIDAGKYDESWKQAAPVFQTGIKQADWQKAVGSVRKPLGKVLSRKLASQQEAPTPGGAPDGKYVVLQFHTDFAQKKGAVETITPFQGKDGKWKVSGYFIK